MAEAELKKARIKCGSIKSALTRARTFLDSDDAITAILSQVHQRKQKIEATWDEFDKVQTTIDLATDEDVMHEERKLFEEAYFDIISRFDELILSRMSAEVVAPPCEDERAHRHEVNNLRLPKIELPSFSGGYEEWYPFHDTFR